MAHQIRSVIACRLVESFQSVSSNWGSRLFPTWIDKSDILACCVRYRPVSKRSDVIGGQLGLSVKLLKQFNLLPELSPTQTNEFLGDIVQKFNTNDKIEKISSGDAGTVQFTLNSSFLSETVITDILSHDYGKNSELYRYQISANASSQQTSDLNTNERTIVVDFSSPNIAKLFHAGHLRSTILGNFVSNINEWFNNKVIRINYLGDWGTQFGLLGIGFEKYCDKEKLASDSLKHLTDIYIKINQDASKDENVRRSALEFFQKLETGDEKAMGFWKLCRDLSISQYSSMYENLGVRFDHIHGESMYVQKSLDLLNRLSSEGKLLTDSETGVGYVDVTLPEDSSPVRVNLVKSDGTTLYITRDVAAAIDRLENFKTDCLCYVVENGQHQHFQQLARLLRKLGYLKVGENGLKHVKFGHIKGLSTRQGGAIHLRDLITESKSLLLKSMKSKSTTKIVSDDEQTSVAERLAITALLVQDLKEYRQSSYTFSLERMLNFNGDTGVFLQYTHARLNSLLAGESERLSEIQPNFDLLTEDSAKRLVLHLARFDEVLLRSYTELEPCHLVNYLFMIGRLTNVAHDELYVKGQPEQLAKTRLILFQSAKTTLTTGLRMLGITPLDRL